MTKTKRYHGLFLGIWVALACMTATAYAFEEAPVGAVDRKSYSIGSSDEAYVKRFGESAFEGVEEAISPQVEQNREPGAVQIEKAFAFSTEYDSNVFLRRNDPKDDVSFIYTPSVGIVRGRKGETKSYLQTFYNLTYVDHVEYQKLSRFNHQILSKIGWRTDKLRVDISNDARPYSAKSAADRTELHSSTTAQVIDHSDTFRLSVAYDVTPKITLSHAYGYAIDYFAASSNENNRGVEHSSEQVHSFNPRISYAWTAKTTLYTDYQFKMSDFFRGGQFASKTQTFNFGLNHVFSLKTALNTQAGWAFNDFNEDGIRSGNGFVYRAAVIHKFSEKLSGTLYTAKSLGKSYEAAGATIFTESLNVDIYSGGVALGWAVTPSMNLKTGFKALFTHRDGYITLTDTENPSLSFTREHEDEIYAWNVDWSWVPKGSWAYYLRYELYNHNASFKNFEYTAYSLLGSLQYTF